MTRKCRPLRIVLVIGSLRIGGTETQVSRLAVELKSAGHDVRVFLVECGGPLSSELEEGGVPYQSFDFEGVHFRNAGRRLQPWLALGAVRRTWQLWRALWNFKPDVVHAFLFWAYALALPGALLGRVPARISARRGITRPQAQARFYAGMEQLSHLCAHVVTANSGAVAEEVRSGSRVPARKIRIIYNGVDIPIAQAGVDSQPARGAIVANLIGYKGHLDLIEALGMMANPPQIFAYGEGRERGKIERRLNELGLSDVFRLCGQVPNARDRFLSVQFAVMASHEEGLPNSVLEAMAAGLPVIATRAGGIPEIIVDGYSGILVPCRDPKALADSLERIAAEPDLRLRLSAEARLRAEDFSWPNCTKAHIDLYEELLGE